MQNLSRDGHGKLKNCHGKVMGTTFPTLRTLGRVEGGMSGNKIREGVGGGGGENGGGGGGEDTDH